MNFQKLLEPLRADLPCGIDPFEDGALYSRMQSLDRLREGTPQEEILEPLMEGGKVALVDGKPKTIVKTIPARPPQWPEFRKECEAVLRQSRHLRAIVLYGVGELHLEGLSAVPQTFEFLRRAIEQDWNELFPRLVDNNASERLQEINELSTTDGDDPEESVVPDPRFHDGVFLAHLREVSLFKLPDGVNVTIRIWEAALYPELHLGVVAPPLDAIQTAWEAQPAADREGKLQIIGDALTELDHLEKILARHEMAANFRRLHRVLETTKACLSGEMKDASSRKLAKEGGQIGSPVLTPIRKREEARQMIKLLCDYFDTHEPSSPVPVFLQLADQFIGKTFLEIMNKSLPTKPEDISSILLDGVAGKLLTKETNKDS